MYTIQLNKKYIACCERTTQHHNTLHVYSTVKLDHLIRLIGTCMCLNVCELETTEYIWEPNKVQMNVNIYYIFNQNTQIYPFNHCVMSKVLFSP